MARKKKIGPATGVKKQLLKIQKDIIKRDVKAGRLSGGKKQRNRLLSSTRKLKDK